MAKTIKKLVKRAPVVEEEILEDEVIEDEAEEVAEDVVEETDEEIVEEEEVAEEAVEEEEEVVEEEEVLEEGDEEVEAEAPVKKVAKAKAAVVPLSKEKIAQLLALKDKFNAAGDVIKARGIRQRLRAAGHYISKQKGFQPFGGKVPQKKAVAAVAAAPIKKVVKRAVR